MANRLLGGYTMLKQWCVMAVFRLNTAVMFAVAGAVTFAGVDLVALVMVGPIAAIAAIVVLFLLGRFRAWRRRETSEPNPDLCKTAS